MKDCIEAYIGQCYGLDVNVKEPNILKQDERLHSLLFLHQKKLMLISGYSRYQSILLKVGISPIHHGGAVENL